MNSKTEIRKIFLAVAFKGAQNSQVHFAHDQSRTGKKVRQSDHDFAKFILDSAEKMESIEDMVAFEQTLQKNDALNAKSQEDISSVLAAQKNYEQLSVTIEQMRKTPSAYFGFIRGHKDTGGDIRKIVKGNSLDFIAANIARMQNRKIFGPVGEHEIWDARIVMAKKTGDMFKALHRELAANFNLEQNTPARREVKQRQPSGRKGKGGGADELEQG